MKFVARYLYAPLFFIVFIGLSTLLISRDANSLLLIPLLLIAITVSFVFERILPFEKNWNKPRGDSKRDAIHALVNETSNILAVSLIPIISMHTQVLNIWPADWPLIFQLCLAILIADFGITLMHYASHKIAVLWRFHAVHHSVQRLYGFNGLMKHPIHQSIELLAGTSPLLLMGMSVDIGALLAFAVVIQLLLQHSNVDMKLSYAQYVWAVAPGHRHHHLASKEHGDVNFGLFTMLWDHLLGTFEVTRRQPRDGELGIANQPNYPSNYMEQLIKPLTK